VPVYRERIDSLERLSLEQASRRLGGFPCVVLAPEGLDVHAYKDVLGDCEVRTLDPRWFRDVRSYNALMLNAAIYSRFADHEFILIYQTDAFAFSDQLAAWCAADLDYVGAPFWAEYGVRKDLGMVAVGNGGFSLRRVEAFLRVLTMPRWSRVSRQLRAARIHGWPEDYFWGERPELRVATIDEAVPFAFETGLEYLRDAYREKVPFGCHANWNLAYIDALRRGSWATPVPGMADRDGDYQHVLRNLLARSGNL